MTLLKEVEIHMLKNPYGKEAQANLLQALRNCIKVFNEPKIKKVLKLTETLPEWVNNWIKGDNISFLIYQWIISAQKC